MKKMNKTVYLGDGLYAKYDGYHVVLMANSSISPTNTVYLDDNVLTAFLKYIVDVKYTPNDDESEDEQDEGEE
jgi:hypothetical protein